ncbi:MAG: hypothetical protein COU68_03645, partial [Candidatus Pacebacteria bacterium CG10_big_fil_rev_8_21_14_0_10_45_6]
VLGLALESRALWPAIFDRMERQKAVDTWERIALGIRASYEAVLHWTSSQEWDLIVHLGDVTCGWKEAGIGHNRLVDVAQSMQAQLAQIAPALFCLGNHDVGWTSVATEDSAGMTLYSVSRCRSIFGPLWWSRAAPGGVLLLGVCSSLASYKGDNHHLREMRQEQEAFVADELRRSTGRGMLFAHEPATPAHLSRLIAPHMTRLARFVYGDLHASWAGSLYSKLLAGTRSLRWGSSRTLALAHSRACFVPAVAPLWHPGHMAMALTLDENGISSERISLPIAAQAQGLPTLNPARCVLWMLPTVMRNIFSRGR